MLESKDDYQLAVDFGNNYRSKLDLVTTKLHKELGTNYFSLCRLRGKYQFSSCIATNMDFGEFWFRTGHILIAPPSNGFFLLSQLKNLYSDELLQSLQVNFGMDNILFYVEHRKNYTDVYSVASDVNRPDVINNYINRGARQLHRFIPSFRESFKNILEEGEETRFIYIQDELAFHHPYSDTSDRIDSVSQTRSLTRIKQFERDLKSLPDRIFDSVELAAAGLTAKESARELHIHHRTVEGHIENAKFRLNVASKQQLIDLFLMVAS